MHEFSIVQALLDQIEHLAHEHSAQKVTRVEVAIGRFSGVEIELFQRAFETFKETPLCHEAVLDIATQEGDAMLLMRLEML